MKLTFFVKVTDIPGPQPSVLCEDLGIGLRQMIIPQHDIIALDLNLSGLPRCCFFPGCKIRDTRLHMFDHMSGRYRLDFIWIIPVRDGNTG